MRELVKTVDFGAPDKFGAHIFRVEIPMTKTESVRIVEDYGYRGQEAGIPRAEVLRIATRNAAIALHREAEQGTVERGKVADLVVLGADPLADLRNTRRIEMVIQRGRILPAPSSPAASRQ